MELKGPVLPGYRVYEYMLILNPHEELRKRITEIRNEFNQAFIIQNGLGATPNLALVNFLQYEMMQERITAKLKTVAMGYPPFKVELKDFGSFPGHTIFINIISRLGIQNLVRQVRTETQSLMKLNNETKPYFLTEPHITLAYKLKPWQYEKAWLKYSNKHFTGHFIADAMLLLKRPKGEKGWQIAERFEFMNLPVTTKQGELFL